MKLRALAKINLGLDVTGKREAAAAFVPAAKPIRTATCRL